MNPAHPSRILVPTDFSPTATHALNYACDLAERFGARLILLNADTFIPPVDFTAIPGAEFDLTRARMIEGEKERLAEYAQARVRPGLPYETVIAVNDPVQAIVEASESACDLVVMGTHGRSGVPRMLFGSVTASVMRLASVPVIAVNRAVPETAAVRRILCPIGFDSVSREALRYAATLVDAPITLFHGIPKQGLQNTIDEVIRLQDWTPDGLEPRCEMIVADNEASAEEIVSLAKETGTDLIALGIPADRRVIDVLRGTLAERIVSQSGCPVLTVSTRAVETMTEAPEEVLVQA